jgi:acetyl esterase/lipase/pimeloyl-ACP methyl ester carboxylesterase
MKNKFTLGRIAPIIIVFTIFSFHTTTLLAQANPVIKNIVIVHGAFTDASGFEAVYKILKKDGYRVTLVQNPLTSLKDDVDATTRALERLDGPAVLVGHSWGGSVITQAGLSPKVASLVYIAAFAPDAGESTLSLYQSAPSLPKNGILPADKNDIVYFDRSLFRECFAAEQNAEKAEFMFDSQQPIVGSCFTTQLTQAAWKTKPSYAILATEDKAINPELQRTMYKRAGAIITELKGSHTLFLSQPKAVARVIEAAATVNAGNKSAIKQIQMNKNAKKNQVLDFKTDPSLSVEVKGFLTALNSGGAALETMSDQAARNVLIEAQASIPVDMSGIEESEKSIKADGYTIKLNLVRPKGATGKLPAFIFIHGGGWILGDYPTHKRMVRDLSVLTGFTGIFVNYTPSPEAKYPQAVNEIYAATKWIAAHGEDINVDENNIAVVGNSVGGNMSAVTTLFAKEHNGPRIKLQVLLWPIVDANFETESYHQFGEDRFLTTSLMKWMYDKYTTDPAQRKEIYASPLQATVDQLKGLPPALIITSENDILRDEAEAYGRKLDEAGVPVTTVRYNGTIHDFGLLNALAEIPQTKAMFLQVAAELKKYLQNN